MTARPCRGSRRMGKELHSQGKLVWGLDAYGTCADEVAYRAIISRQMLRRLLEPTLHSTGWFFMVMDTLSHAQSKIAILSVWLPYRTIHAWVRFRATVDNKRRRFKMQYLSLIDTYSATLRIQKNAFQLYHTVRRSYTQDCIGKKQRWKLHGRCTDGFGTKT